MRLKTNPMRKLVLFIAALICAVVGAIAQTITVTSAAAAGPGTLNAAIAASLGAAEVRVINFQIPGVGPHIINPGNILLNAANTLTIEATAIQAGWSAAQSNIILRGSGTGNCFTVNRSNFTLRGLIIQNYVNGYVQLSGINNLIEGCWIGVNNTGTASSNNLTDDGIYVNGNAGNNKVTVDNCVISGCGKVGIHFNGAQAGSIVSNSFVGTDKTGTLPVQNGATLDAENFHGILIDNTPGVQIITNVISANASGGIDIRGANSGNSDIRGNKIGTDITGNKPLGNNTFGVRIKGSNGHTIGGASINDRNIISANGTDKYRFFAYSTGLPNEVDWYNSSGIYLGNSKNNKIINNYIGVKASGNSSKDVLDYDLGNFYCGIKIETGSANTIIKDNIVSGNGFRSFEAYAAITYPTNNGGETMKGHGILIKDATTSGNVLTGNYVGIGADGSTKIGNKQDGVSIQGATGTIIGGNSAALRNVLSGNTWGLTISSNYFNSQSSDIEVYGNYVGTDATGTLAVGNSEGGIGVTNYTKGTIIGSANPGDRNIISGNGSGISLLGKSPAIGTDGGKASEFAVVYGNYIGYGANGTTPIPNLGNGLIISEGSNNNTIGGPAAFANRIANNSGHGIYSNTGTTNTISGNIITNNTLSGVFLDAAINNTVSANQIFANNSHGITLRSASNGNKFFNNIIGDLTLPAKANKGDGINITGSSNNIIGGVNAGEGNTIANNTANGIVMLGTSNNNSIHRNIISCNAGRGIELNNVANGNYAAPTYSGSETALVVTGPAGSFIELYSLDGCNNCSGTDVNKLQGKTFITSGPSPLNYAGTAGVTYTATASAGNTTAAHKTSEFSDCYSLCTKPIITKTVSGSTVCQNVDGTVTINNPEPLRYDAKIGTLSVANGIGAGATLVLTIPKAALGNATKTITFTATPNGGGCTPIPLTNTTQVIVNPPVKIDLTVQGSTICPGTNGETTILASESISYQAYMGNIPVGSPVNGPGTIKLIIPEASLVTGSNVISFKGSPTGTGCLPVPLTNTATVILNPPFKADLNVSGNTVCPGTDGQATISASQAISYQAFKGGSPVGSPVDGPGNILLTIPSASLVPGNNTISFKGTPTGIGCSARDLDKTAIIVVNSDVKINLSVIGDTICSGVNAVVSIVASESLSYQAYIGNTAVGSPVNGPGDIKLIIPSNNLVEGDNVIRFEVTPTGGGCKSVPLNNKATVILNPAVNSNLVVVGDTVCAGTPAKVIIKAAQNLNYKAILNSAIVGSGRGISPNDLIISIPTASLVEGSNLVSFTGQFDGKNCPVTPLNNKATVILNPSVITDLKVTGDTVCQGDPASVMILATQNLLYTAFKNKVQIGSSQGVNPGNTTITIAGSDLTVGINTITFKGQFKGDGCPAADLDNSAIVIMNSPPKIDSDVQTNTPICFGQQGILTVVAAEKGKIYQVTDQNNIKVSEKVESTVNGALVINLYSLAVNTYTLTVNASVPGCNGLFKLTKTAPFKVNPGLNSALSITYKDTICLGERDTITIVNSQLDVEYQAFNNAGDAPLSGKVIGTGGIIKVPLTALAGGNTEVYFNAVIGGCGSVRLGNTAKIFVNTDVKKDLTASATSPICLGEVAIITIVGAEKDKYYQAFENKIPVSTKVPGNNGTITLNVPSLGIGDHKFTINVTVPGCKDDTLLQNPITKVNSSPDSTLKVGTNGPVCDGNQAVFYILKSQIGKKYEIFNGANSVSQQKDGNGDTLKINLTNLIPGTYILTAKATSAGCSNSIDLKDKGTITINKNPTKDLNATVKGPVCLGNPTEVTVELAEDGKFYEVFYNGKSISASTKGSGSDLKIPISTTIIPAGSNPLTIGISVPGCVPDTLTKKPVLEINSKASDSLLLSAVVSPICVGTDGAVRITGIQPKVSYQAYIGSDSVSQTITGPGPDIILPVPATKLLPGMNSISVKAFIDGCTVSDLKDTAGIKVNPNPKVDLAISVDPSTICEGGESILTISTTEEGVSYQAVVGTKPYSSAVLSTGGEVKLTVFGLPQGVNIVGVEAFVQGCLKRNLDSTVSITVNKGPKLDYSVTGSTVCIGDSGKLTISGSEAGVLYQAFEKTSNGIFSRKVTGTGNAIVITLNPSTNPSDTIIVKAEITGCGIVRLENSGILITNDKNASKNLSTVGSTICINDVNATATIKNAIKDVSYEATFNSAKLPSQIGTGGDLIFNLPTSILSKGSYKVTFTATVQACGPVALDSVATVVINDNKSSKDLQVKGSDICVMDASGTATILSAIDGVTYQASINGKELPEKLIGEGADLVFTIPVVNINMGSNTVSFVATISGCTPVELTNKAIINRNDNTTSKDLSTRGSTVCANDPNATATIISAKSGISYQAFLGDKAVSDKLLANGSDLVLSIVTNQLASGQNVISFIATVAGCDPVKLDSNAIVVVIGDRYNIKGSSLRCYSTTGEYGITPVPGITVYKWTVPEGSKITSDSTGDRITVAFGEKSGKVTVTPVGNIGACDGVSSELYVSVEPSYKENLNILGKNLVCIKDGDIIQVDTVGVIGVDYIVWNMTQGIRINDTINKKSIFRKFNITYTRAGFETIIARPHIRCSDTFGKEDTLRVEVLEYPVAEAGDYPLIENDLSSAVNLNGTGSTENVNAATSFINYKWYSTDRTIQINNPNTLNSASFVPTSSETKVYLKVSERNGLCPALDSAIINLTIGIQIPNIFTPNGDGVHDLWEIKNLNKLYPNCSVEVFNKWGSYIFKSNGYSEPWDGTRNGEDLPVATYYYVVDFKDGSKPRTGSVTIIR